jgi:DNA-binding transcriptional regulator/RsmH inhibitor MraZ
MYDWPLNDAVLACVTAIIIGSIVTTLTTVRRAEFSRLQNEVKQLSMMQNDVKRLSKKITALEVDEERRFLVELNKPTSAVAHRPPE